MCRVAGSCVSVPHLLFTRSCCRAKLTDVSECCLALACYGLRGIFFLPSAVCFCQISPANLSVMGCT